MEHMEAEKPVSAAIGSINVSIRVQYLTEAVTALLDDHRKGKLDMDAGQVLRAVHEWLVPLDRLAVQTKELALDEDNEMRAIRQHLNLRQNLDRLAEVCRAM